MLELADPAMDNLAERHRVEIMQLFPPLPVDGDEIGGFENMQMLGHRLPRHGHAAVKIGQILAVPDEEPVEQGAAGFIGKGGEDIGHGF